MPIKWTTTSKGEKRGQKQIKKIQQNLQNKSKHKNNNFFLDSLLSESFPSLGSPQKICSLKDRWAGTREGRAFQQKDGARGGRAGVTVLPFGAPMAKEQVGVVGAW